MWRLCSIICLVSAACGGAVVESLPPTEPTVTMLFAGDVMLGRGVQSVAEADPNGLFGDVRFAVAAADLAFANLESPLTRRPHVGPSYALEANPEHARLIQAAGFDAVSIANNHAGDAGPPSVTDTLEALEAAGVGAIGGGRSLGEAKQPQLFEVGGLTVAALAFDISGAGLPAGAGPGILRWDVDMARDLVDASRPGSDLVTVAIHGGIEYQSARDETLWTVANELATWGVDVVWGHGPHVVQPVAVIDPDADGRSTVVATSLGNFLFDQDEPGTRRGAVLEVLGGEDGVHAYRVGAVEHGDGRVHLDEWVLPDGDAVLLGSEWWTLVAGDPAVPEDLGAITFSPGDIRDFGIGDVTGDGDDDLVVAFRRPFRETEVTRLYPEREWTDSEGRSAHLGVYRPDDLRQWWVAGSLFRPIEQLAVCDGGIAVGYTDLDGTVINATGGWRWQGFGFAGGQDLPGRGMPACLDVDGDGRSDPAIVGRP